MTQDRLSQISQVQEAFRFPGKAAAGKQAA
jgi:hypothetical protein